MTATDSTKRVFSVRLTNRNGLACKASAQFMSPIVSISVPNPRLAPPPQTA